MACCLCLLVSIEGRVSAQSPPADSDWCYVWDFSEVSGALAIDALDPAYPPSQQINSWRGNTSDGKGSRAGLIINFPQPTTVTYAYALIYVNNNASNTRMNGIGLRDSNDNMLSSHMINELSSGWYEFEVGVTNGVSSLEVRLGSRDGGSYADIYELHFYGDGDDPISVYESPCILPTPTPSLTPTITPTLDPNVIIESNNLCSSGANIDPSEVNAQYAQQCNHCLHYEQPTSVWSSPTPNETQIANMTLMPAPTSSVPTSTPIYTVDDVTPLPDTPAPNPTTTPSPNVQGFTFDGSSIPSWLDVKYGTELGAYQDVQFNGYWHRIVSLQVQVPTNSSGVPYRIDSIYLDYDITSPTYTALNAYYVARGSGGQDIGSSWFPAPASGNGFINLRPGETEGGSYISMPNDGVSFIEVAVMSSRYVDVGSLDGSLTVNYVNLFYHEDWVESSGSSVWGSSDVVCYRPQDYPAPDVVQPEDVFNINFLQVPNQPDCYTIFPHIDFNGIISAIPGVDTTQDYQIPRVDACVYWVTLGDMMFLGQQLPIGVLISIGAFFLLVRMLRSL